MKNAIILHGLGATPEKYWYQYVEKELSNQGFNVWLPQLPNTAEPDPEEQLDFILKNGQFTSETTLIGHSSGCPLLLRVLEKIDVKINQAFLVAGYFEPIKYEPSNQFLKKFDWEKIKDHCEHFTFINSDNDPWGCNDKQGRVAFDKLGGKQIIMHGEGHMGSNSYNQPYKEFPFLVKLIV